MPPTFDDPRALARAATAIENGRPEAEQIAAEVFPRTGRALLAGITGAPGSGKSTLVNEFVRLLRRAGQKVGVIAVDPSSPWTGGAILGDRIRMQDHHADPGVFIRSMATRGRLGGVARSTLDLALLLDAAGADTVLIETVGVGQDEIEIARLADVVAVVLVPGMGDDVQAIKAGIMEIADVFLLNKADHPGADRLDRVLRETGTTVPVVRTVATEGAGVEEALAAIRAAPRRSNETARWQHRLRELVRDRVIEGIPDDAFAAAAADVAERRVSPRDAAEQLLAAHYSLATTH
ncbi:MAG TPA: methylmalonyl Co-A mutase-associated GTPase MeaB [Bryobacteraceae bacterium]|nr:methylmalonyl Co-A mutase-associated GTPase MeaB [Bryobacteraceae bacterium]